jgi:hypothetical protein
MTHKLIPGFYIIRRSRTRQRGMHGNRVEREVEKGGMFT